MTARVRYVFGLIIGALLAANVGWIAFVLITGLNPLGIMLNVIALGTLCYSAVSAMPDRCER